MFEESTAYALSTGLKARDIDLDALVRWSDLKVVALTGVRRSGKSSLLMLLAQHLRVIGLKVAYINAEDSRLARDTLLEDAIKWFGDSGYLIVDEITSAADWSGWLARNHDLLKGRLRIIVSSSRSGLMEPPKELRGRVRAIEISPLSFAEYLNFNEVSTDRTTAGRGLMERSLMEYLTYGGFPEVSRMVEPLAKVIIANDYFQQILALDVGEAASEDVAATRLFGRYVLSVPYFSASKCLNHFKSVGYKIGKEKILRLEHYSQSGFLFFFLQAYGASVKDRSVYPRKAYPSDPGFLYSAGGVEDRGRLLECAIYLELRRRLAPDEEVLYWTDKGQMEVDFVTLKGAGVKEAVQVSWEMMDPRTRKREVRALQSCLDGTGCDRGRIITWDEQISQMIEDPRIEVVSALDWFLEGVDLRRS
ncbi:MAG: ATP-binding protein [Methanomassiliicoccales archaeon]